ncbi:MAG: ester cyclase [Hyphomicrobium sp. 32-62-53]|nr:MAG: ester cyclase [Hyphomicrobium sp. 12-62-95]OYY00366.1 MAG: ester cyclase [Hyphomicrobium sp. 32-62-53]
MSTATVEHGQATAAPGAVLAALAEDVFNRRDFSRLPEFMRADYIQHNPLVPQGSAGFQEFFSAWFAASPDFKHEVKQLAVHGDRVWVYGTYSGTHSGEWLGIPATGKSYRFDAVDIFRVENGKLAEHWDVLDVHTLFRQLGE